MTRLAPICPCPTRPWLLLRPYRRRGPPAFSWRRYRYGAGPTPRRSATFSASHRYVLDYLTQEVLERQTEPVREFLLETSVLDRLSGELCDASPAGPVDRRCWKRLSAPIFLVPLDEVRGWWRYHHLFADLLRAPAAGAACAVHGAARSAAAWHEEHAQTDEAVRHARPLEMSISGQAHRATRRRASLRGGSDRRAVARRAARPDHPVRPRLLLAQVVLAFQGGQVEAVDGLLDAAERAYADVGQESEAQSVDGATAGLANVLGRIAHYRAFLAELRGDIDATTAFACGRWSNSAMASR